MVKKLWSQFYLKTLCIIILIAKHKYNVDHVYQTEIMLSGKFYLFPVIKDNVYFRSQHQIGIPSFRASTCTCT